MFSEWFKLIYWVFNEILIKFLTNSHPQTKYKDDDINHKLRGKRRNPFGQIGKFSNRHSPENVWFQYNDMGKKQGSWNWRTRNFDRAQFLLLGNLDMSQWVRWRGLKWLSPKMYLGSLCATLCKNICWVDINESWNNRLAQSLSRLPRKCSSIPLWKSIVTPWYLGKSFIARTLRRKKYYNIYFLMFFYTFKILSCCTPQGYILTKLRESDDLLEIKLKCLSVWILVILRPKRWDSNLKSFMNFFVFLSLE